MAVKTKSAVHEAVAGEPATIEERLAEITLAAGGHMSPNEGLCLMEAVALFAGEPHSDHPQCACPVLTSFGITLNDRLPDAQRQKLKALVPKLIGTRNADLEQRRMWFLIDKAVRVFVPLALKSAGSVLRKADLESEAQSLESEATKLEALGEVDSWSAWSAWSAAKSAWSAAESAAKSAESAAESAAWSAAESAAKSAESAWSAAWSAAKSAWSAAESAAWSAAWSAESAAESAAEIYDRAIEVFEQAIAIQEVR